MQLDGFTPDQRAGQRLMIGFNGTRMDDRLQYCIGRLKIGGLILFSRNLESPGQISELCRSVQAYALQCGQPPLFIGIDQEGGQVARLKPPFTQFDGAPHIQTVEDASRFAQITASELLGAGINMDMAPVLDVLPDEGQSVMAQRSFGRDPEHVSRMGCTIIDQMQHNGVLAVAKHFPGIGRTVLDSHMDLPDLNTDRSALMARDLAPFAAAIRTRVSGIMLSHIRYRAIDPRWPASLSETIARDLLRSQMGFDGLVLTDDIDMGAIAKHYGTEDIVQQCLNACIDIILVCHESPKIDAVFDMIKTRCEQDPLSADHMDASLRRIFRAKHALGRIDSHEV